MTREQWLLYLIDALRPLFKDACYDLPKDIRVSVGFPSKKATGPKRRIGECHHAGMSDGIPQVFISPTLGNMVEIGATLVHELCHVLTPGAQHKGQFIIAARAVGLAGKPTATVASEDLAKKLTSLCDTLTANHGPFPHSVLLPAHETKQKGRLIKLVCECAEPRILRTTRKVISQGSISCGECLADFEVV